MKGLWGALRRRWGRTGVVTAAFIIAGVGYWSRPHDVPTHSQHAATDAAPNLHSNVGKEGEQPFLAMDGTIYTDKLFHGLLDLETSPKPVTADEATRILFVLGLLERKFRKNQYFDDQVTAILSPEQNRYLEKNAVGITGEKMHENFSPDLIRGVVDDLETISGTKRPATPVEIPDDVRTPNRPATISRMTTFMIGFRGMQRDPALAIAADEAARLLPFVDAYVQMKSMKQSTKHDILAILSDDQKRWIDAHPSQAEAVGDMTRLEAQVKSLMETRAGN